MATEGIGHNSKQPSELGLLLDRIDRLEEEKKGIAGDVRDVYAEGKARGFDTKMMRKARAIRNMDKQKRQEEEAILDAYLMDLGLL